MYKWQCVVFMLRPTYGKQSVNIPGRPAQVKSESGKHRAPTWHEFILNLIRRTRKWSKFNLEMISFWKL